MATQKRQSMKSYVVLKYTLFTVYFLDFVSLLYPKIQPNHTPETNTKIFLYIFKDIETHLNMHKALHILLNCQNNTILNLCNNVNFEFRTT
jgi:hypothetical protein